MPGSGVRVTDACVKLYDQMKLRKKERCIIYVINDDKTEFTIWKAIDKIDDQKEQFESIVQNEINKILAVGDEDQKSIGKCCWVVWDLKMPAKTASKDGQKTDKPTLVFMGICVDDLNVKERMMYSTSMKALKEELTGIPKVLEVKSVGEMEYESVMDALK